MVMSLREALDKIKNAKFGKEVRPAMHDGILRANEISDGAFEAVSDNIVRQGNLETQVTDMFIEMTDKDIVSAPEIIGSRDGRPDLSTRLAEDFDAIDTQVSTVHSRLSHLVLNVRDFGAVGDGIHDDRLAIQNTIDYAAEQKIPKVFIEGDFFIKSEHPDKPGVGLYLPVGVSITGDTPATSRLFTSIILVTFIEVENANVSITNIRIVGTDKSYASIKVVNGIKVVNATSKMKIEEVIISFCQYGFYADSLWQSVFEKVTYQNCDTGMYVALGTSITLISVGPYACERGIVFNNINYTNIISSYGERCGLALQLTNCDAVVIDGFGSEFSDQILKVSDSRNIEVGSIYVGAIGRNDTNTTDKDYLFEFINVEGGHFYGINMQYSAVKGVTLFDNVRKFNFRHGRGVTTNTSYVNSKITHLDEQNLIVQPSTFYIDYVNGSDTNKGNTSAAPFKTLEAVMSRLPKVIAHDVFIRLLTNYPSPMNFQGISTVGLAKLTVLGHNAALNIQVHSVIISSFRGEMILQYLKSTNGVIVRHSDAVTFRDFDFLAETGLSIYSGACEVRNSTFSCVTGIDLRQNVSAYIDTNTGSTNTWIRNQGSMAFIRGSEPSGSVSLIAGGQVFR